MDRRIFLSLAVAGATLPKTVSARSRPTRAQDLLRRYGVIDMLQVFTLAGARTPPFYARQLNSSEKQVFRDSGLSVMHHAVGLGGPDAFALALRFMAAWSGFVASNADLFQLARRVQDFDQARATGSIAVILGIQCSDHFRSPDDVDLFYSLGQRCSQLTYNEQNWIGSGSTERVDGGVSDFGAAIIARMNKVGMLVDVSHSGDRTTLDAIQISEQPIAFTHANVRALNPDHPRCKTDEAIRGLAAKGGVMGISGVRMFLSAAEPTSVETIVNHIDHVAQLVGVDHVGIGSDADLFGYDKLTPAELEQTRRAYKPSYRFRAKIDTDGFDDPRRFEHLTEALIRRGYKDEDIHSVLGGNFRRLLASVWK